MMSASAMSAAIRAKKKKMEEDESGAVKLSGIPEDATDILVIKNKEPGEALSENMPMEDGDGAAMSPEAEMSEEERAQKSAKREKIRLMLNKMNLAI